MPEVGYELYRLIKVSGGDAAEFLQGQLTQDIGLLHESKSLPAAWCNPRGRVIVTMRVIELGDAIGLAVAEDICEGVCEKLTRFRLRADVSFDISGDDWSSIAIRRAAVPDTPIGGESLQSAGVTAVAYDSGHPVTEFYGPAAAIPAVARDVALSDDDWKLGLIQAGIPVISVANSEKFTAHMLNLDRLAAVSFVKGCYTGQEVVARTEHLGSSKRRLMRYRCESAAVAVGDKLADNGMNVGEVVNVSGNDLLAVTPVAIHEQQLTINGFDATPRGLPY